MPSHLIKILAVTFFIFPLAVSAADRPVEVKRKQQTQTGGVDQNLREKINFARQLMRDRNYEGATALLEVLYETETDNQVIINLLQQCYNQQQLFAKTEELVRRQVQLHPDNTTFLTTLAEAVARQGRKDDALDYFREAKSKITSKNEIRFQIIIQSMLAHNMDADAKEFILDWRKQFNDSTLLGMQMGILHELQKEYTAAVSEYYPILADTTRLGNDVEKKVLNLLHFADSGELVESFLLSQPDIFSSQRGVKILSSYYLKTGAFDKAFDFTKTRDSLEQLNGASLLAYMKNCNNRKLYHETIRMGEYLHEKYTSEQIQSSSNFVYAEALTQLGMYTEALALYDSVFINTENRLDKSAALYHAGVIYQNNLFDIPTALHFYDSVCNKYQFGFSYMNSLLARPYCYLQTGDIKRARQGYGELAGKRLSEESKEQVDYYTAVLYFLDKQIDSSRVKLSKLVIDYPRGFFVNDALELMKIIDEGKESEQVLYDYSNVLLFEFQREYDSVMQKLDFIAHNQSGLLADFAFYKLILMSSDMADREQTILYVDSLTEKYPESYYMPYGLKIKADLFFEDNNKSTEAIDIYKRLLEQYTNYPFISEIREKLRAIADKESA